MKIEDLCSTLGFNEYERKVFLTLIRTGEGKASDISKLSGVPQNRVYDVLNGFYKKQILTIFPTTPKKYKLVDVKSILQRHVEIKETELKQLNNALKTIKVPEESPHEAEKIWVLKGDDAWTTIGLEMSRRAKKEDLVVLGPYFKFSWKWVKLSQEKAKEKVKTRMIVNLTEENRTQVQNMLKHYKNTEIRHYPLHETRFAVIDNKEVRLGIISKDIPRDQRVCIHIKNEELAKMLTDYFETLWKKAEYVKNLVNKKLS